MKKILKNMTEKERQIGNIMLMLTPYNLSREDKGLLKTYLSIMFEPTKRNRLPDVNDVLGNARRMLDNDFRIWWEFNT